MLQLLTRRVSEDPRDPGVPSMLGAIAGDIIGSVYEAKKSWQRDKTPHFVPLFDPKARFTDDTVLTVAVAEHDLAHLIQGHRANLSQ